MCCCPPLSAGAVAAASVVSGSWVAPCSTTCSCPVSCSAPSLARTVSVDVDMSLVQQAAREGITKMSVSAIFDNRRSANGDAAPAERRRRCSRLPAPCLLRTGPRRGPRPLATPAAAAPPGWHAACQRTTAPPATPLAALCATPVTRATQQVLIMSSSAGVQETVNSPALAAPCTDLLHLLTGSSRYHMSG
jgi:hypothetical protein